MLSKNLRKSWKKLEAAVWCLTATTLSEISQFCLSKGLAITLQLNLSDILSCAAEDAQWHSTTVPLDNLEPSTKAALDAGLAELNQRRAAGEKAS